MHNIPQTITKLLCKHYLFGKKNLIKKRLNAAKTEGEKQRLKIQLCKLCINTKKKSLGLCLHMLVCIV